MTIFHHQTKTEGNLMKRFTLAAALPDKIDLIEAAKSFVSENKVILLMSIGIAKVNPKDQFNRVKGRELSEARLASVKAEVKEIHSSRNQVHLHLSVPELDELGFTLSVYYHRDSTEVRSHLFYTNGEY